jgi:hypothetical protein
VRADQRVTLSFVSDDITLRSCWCGFFRLRNSEVASTLGCESLVITRRSARTCVICHSRLQKLY